MDNSWTQLSGVSPKYFIILEAFLDFASLTQVEKLYVHRRPYGCILTDSRLVTEHLICEGLYRLCAMNFSWRRVVALLPMRLEGHNVTLSYHSDMYDKSHDNFEILNQQHLRDTLHVSLGMD